jgi:hypothetical protein
MCIDTQLPIDRANFQRACLTECKVSASRMPRQAADGVAVSACVQCDGTAVNVQTGDRDGVGGVGLGDGPIGNQAQVGCIGR